MRRIRSLLPFALFWLPACSSLNWHDSLESLPSQYSVVTGRVRIWYRGVDTTSRCKIGFRGDAPAYQLDDTGRVAFRLPKGFNEISSIACLRATTTEHWRFLRPGELVIDVAEAPHATYFGDVVLRWESPSPNEAVDRTLASFGSWAGGNGDFLSALSGGDPLVAEVAIGSSKGLVERFGFETEIVTSPLRIAPHLLPLPQGAILH